MANARLLHMFSGGEIVLKKSVQALLLALLLVTGLFQAGTPSAYAAAVVISQSGSVVTAANGTLTVTYDLSTGKGSIAAGSTVLMSNFYSDYTVAGNSTRIRSTDPGTRTAAWASVGTDAYGQNGKKLTVTSALSSGSTIVLTLTMYENKPYILTDMTVSKSTPQTIDFLEPIAADNLDIGTGSDKRIYTTPYNNNYDFGVAPVHDFGSSENGTDRVYGSTDTWGPYNGTSYWVAAMFDNTAKKGFIAGAATTQNWKSMQYLRQAASANGALTGFSVYNAGGSQSGVSVSSDKFFLGYYDDYQNGLEQFGSVYAAGQPKLSWTGGVPKGYNSYYTFYGLPTYDSMRSMVDYFAANLKPLGYTYMNLDCCYKGASGTGLNTDFQDFASYVHGKGMKAGGYEVPFGIFYKLTDPVPGSPGYTFQDIALKDSSGNPIRTYLDCYIVDATHPIGQAFMKRTMKYYFVDTGFDYVKLDFLDFGMYEGNHYDPSKNGMQNYRIGMGIVRDELLSAAQSIFIDESIAPLMPSGYAHGRRSGIDTSIALQGNLYPGVERQALNTAASWWSNGTLYQYNDPDMVLPENLANGFDKTTFNEGRLLSTVITLGGGHLLLGDNVPFISEDRLKSFQKPELISLANNGKAARPVRMTNFYHKLEHSPSAIYYTDANGDKIVGLSNWDMNNAASNSVTFADLGLSPSVSYTVTELYSGTKAGTFTGSYTRLQQPGESVILRISTASSSLPAAPVNLAAGKAATASSTWSANAGYEAAKVTDGTSATRWSAEDGQTANQWVEVNFGSATAVNRVVVKEYAYGSQNFQVETYRLQYWNGSAYVNLTNGYTLGDMRTFDFPTVTTSKIRLYMTNSRFIPSINEIEAYNIAGNTGSVIDQDASTGAYSAYSDIRAQIQRMQTFTITSSNLPKIDLYLYESYVNAVPKDNYYIDIVQLDANNNPVQKLFTASLYSSNIPGSPAPYSIYPRLTGLDTTKKYGIILRSPGSLDDGSTNNKFGFAYSDSNPYPGGFERLSTNGGASWSTENNGGRDLIFTVYK